jgi:hypothetical protein
MGRKNAARFPNAKNLPYSTADFIRAVRLADLAASRAALHRDATQKKVQAAWNLAFDPCPIATR